MTTTQELALKAPLLDVDVRRRPPERDGRPYMTGAPHKATNLPETSKPLVRLYARRDGKQSS